MRHAFNRRKNKKQKNRHPKQAHKGKARPKSTSDGKLKVESGIPGSLCKNNVFLVLAKFPKRKLKFAGKWRLQATHAQITSNTAGLQDATSYFGIGTIAQITGGGTPGTSIQNYGPTTGPIGYNQLNPSLLTTGNSVFGTPIVPYANRFFWKHCQVDMEFNNTSDTGCCYDVFLCQAKKPAIVGLLPTDVWSAGYAEEAGPWPSSTYLGAGVTTGGVIGYPKVEMPGSHPGQSRKFKDWWKILSVKSFNLAPGQDCSLNFSIVMNKVMDMSKYLEMQTRSIVIAPGTLYFMTRLRGAVGVDATSTLTPTFLQAQVAHISRVTNFFQEIEGGAAAAQALELIGDKIPTAAILANQKSIHQYIDTNVGAKVTS